MKAAVIGHPIAHSKSPIIHNYWMDQNNISGTYEAIDIHPDNLNNGISQLIEEGYDGFNVTIPYKKTIIDFCDEIDESAKNIGAVNTVKIKDKKLFGMNTDAFGFVENIKQSIPNTEFKNKKAFILGAGGAANAVIYGLIDAGISNIKITNRTKETAEKIQSKLSKVVGVVDWDRRDEALGDIDFLINTTSLGMVGKPPLEIDLSRLSKKTIVSDIVYAPLMTDLLQQAQLQGNETVTGIGMLLHQARPAFQAWTGILPAITEELEKKVLS